MRTSFVFGLLAAWLAVPALAGDVAAIDSLERSLARLVNEHALPMNMIVGKHLADGACVLELDRNFQRAENPELALAQSRIFRELDLSNIQYDIRRFNAPRTIADGNLFKVDDEYCKPSRYLPQIAEFRPPSVRRTGKLTVQYLPTGSDPTLVEIEVVTAGKTHVLRGLREERLDRASELNLADPRGPVIIGNEDLILRWNESVLVDWSLGRWPLLRNFNLNDKTRIRVRNGSSVSEVGEVASARSGSRVAFPEGAVLTVLQIGKNGLPVPKAQVSWRRLQTARALFSRDEHGREYWGREPTNFEAQIVESLRTSTSPAPNAVVTLTLQPPLNARLQRVLDTATTRARGSGKSWNGYGSIVLMDAMSGHFIGAVGYPTAPRPRRLPGDTVVADEGFREEFLKKRNIGSVAKAPLAYAIISTTPALVGLTLKPYPAGDQHSVLGIEVEKYSELGDASCAGRTQADFECFLMNSLNRYAVTLLTLAAIPRLDQGDLLARVKFAGRTPLGPDAFSLRDKEVTQQPRDLLWTREPSGEQLQGLAWVQYARSEYDVDVALSSDTGYATQVVHGYMWRDAFVNGVATAASVQSIAPEKENLRLNQARKLRANYVPLILGGGESAWSSTKVAEVFARTITGRRIEGSFVYGRSYNWRNLKGTDNPEVRAARGRYLAGLQAVFVAGTGHKFGGNVTALKGRAQATNLELSVYAKSGTPTIERYEFGAAADDGYLHPIDRAFRTNVLSAQRSSEGVQIYLRGKLIDAGLVKALEGEASLPDSYAPLRLRHLRFLARFNGSTPEAKALICDAGSTSQCRWPDEPLRNEAGTAQPRRAKGYARNYAVYAELRSPADGRICRAVSMAVSFSEKGDPFNDMMNALLEPGDGALSRALGLDDGRKQQVCNAE